MQLRFDPERPIYQQIIDEFKRAVARGDLKPGDRIPSQRELATQARVNPNTVQRAYREMEWMGLVETLRGQGTFIANEPALLASIKAEMADEAVQRFVSEMRALGFSPREILERTERAVAVGKGRTDGENADGSETAGGNAGDGYADGDGQADGAGRNDGAPGGAGERWQPRQPGLSRRRRR